MADYKHEKTILSEVIIENLFNKPTFKEKYSNYCANYRKSNKLVKLLFTTNTGMNHLLR